MPDASSLPEREYVVLEEWTAYVEVIVTAPNKKVAVERAKELMRSTDRADFVLETGHPTGRYEARRA